MVIYDPFVPPEKIRNDGYEALTLQELFKQADYITVHVPKMKNTANLIEGTVKKVKDGSELVARTAPECE